MDQLINVGTNSSGGSSSNIMTTSDNKLNKLQAHKSSYQAWKCVSFGCSLIAIVLLLSKWYEVSTDLKLLLGIEQLLSLQASSSSSGTTTSNSTNQLSWPPIPLDQLLPALELSSGDTNSSSANANPFGMETMESNSSMLMSHMHMSLNRELNGDQLLRQEVQAFTVEFRNAKSTLSLSLILVSVYIVSWILMILAISDGRITNDISLRNILVLSVFGAIDLTASVGFVMVRVIMYSVKNGSFAREILETGGIKETPVRLSADQLTAFTALRLIAMRSCSAYIDLYVSVLVILLTILRLYAILKAMTYYRRIRRFNDRFQYRQLHLEQHHQHHLQQPQTLHITTSDHKPQIWSTSSFLGNGGGRAINENNNHHNNNQQSHTTSHQMISSHPSFKGGHFLAPQHHRHHHQQSSTFEPAHTNHYEQQTIGFHELNNNELVTHYKTSTKNLKPIQQSIGTFRYKPQAKNSASLHLSNLAQIQSTKQPSVVAADDETQIIPTKHVRTTRTNGTSLIILPERQREELDITQQQMSLMKNYPKHHHQHRSHQAFRVTSAPNLLLINGQPHQLMNKSESDQLILHHNRQQQQQLIHNTSNKEFSEPDNNLLEQQQVVADEAEEGLEMSPGLTFAQLNESDRQDAGVNASSVEQNQREEDEIMLEQQTDPNNNNNSGERNSSFYTLDVDIPQKHDVSKQHLIVGDGEKQQQKSADLEVNENLRADQLLSSNQLIGGGTLIRNAGGTSYTLLSANQLDKLSRKLLTTSSSAANLGSTNAKYKLVSRYKHSATPTSNLEQRPKSLYVSNSNSIARQQQQIIRQLQLQQQQQQQQQVFQRVVLDNQSPSCSETSASYGPDDSDGSLMESLSAQRQINRQQQRRRAQQLQQNERRSGKLSRQIDKGYLPKAAYHRDSLHTTTAAVATTTLPKGQQQLFELATGEPVELSPVSISIKQDGGSINQQLLLGKCSPLLFGGHYSHHSPHHHHHQEVCDESSASRSIESSDYSSNLHSHSTISHQEIKGDTATKEARQSPSF